MVIQWLNHCLAYLIIFTTLASLIHAKQSYEQELHHKNQLLETQKEEYHYLAKFDYLTNLPNRRYFIEHLQEIISNTTPDQCITLFFIDLDNFKSTNDRYGHHVGDNLLIETSKRLKRCFRPNDFIARIGGDEFTAIMIYAKTDTQLPVIAAQRIMKEFEPPFLFDNKAIHSFSLSIGFATYPEDATSASDLMIKADLAMYTAKKTAGSSYYST